MVIVAMLSLPLGRRLAHLLAQVRRHVPIDILEHRRQRRDVAVQHRAMLQRQLQGGGDLGLVLRDGRLVLGLGPGPQADQVLLQPRDRVAEREVLPVVRRPVARGVVRGGVHQHAVGHTLDQTGAAARTGALHRLLRRAVNRQDVVAIYLDARHPVGCGRGQEKQPVLDDQEADHLTDLLPSEDHHGKADQDNGQRDGEGVLGEEETHADHGLNDVIGQDHQPSRNEQGQWDGNDKLDLLFHIQPLDHPLEDHWNSHHFDDQIQGCSNV